MLENKHGWPCPAAPGPNSLSLSPKAVHYTDTLEKVVRNKEQSMLHLQDTQKHERPMENSFPTVQSSGLIHHHRDSSAYWSEKQVFHMLPSVAYGCDHNTKGGMSLGGTEEQG